MTGDQISDFALASRIHIVHRETRSSDLPAYAVVRDHAKGEESQLVSPIRVFVVEVLGLKLNMQSLVLIMHGSENRLSLMGDTLHFALIPFF